MSASRFCTAGSASASSTAALSFAMISFGVPLGAHIACQIETWKPGSPASSVVGMSGAEARRVAGHRVGAHAAALCDRERARGLVDDHVELAGEHVLQRGRRAAERHELEFVAGDGLERQAAICGGLARPPVPNVTLSGLALSQAMSSLRSCAGSELRDMISIGPVESNEIGSKSFTTIVGERIDRAVDDVMVHAADDDACSRPDRRATTRPVPIVPEAPPTFSMMMLLPERAAACAPSRCGRWCRSARRHLPGRSR